MQLLNKADEGLRSSHFWREWEEKVRTKAQGMHDEGAKATMLQIASLYGRMAERAADREDGSPTEKRSSRS